MLGITYHNPATISVFLDRMRFRDCFISSQELKDGEWKRKLKSFVDVPSDGRERVVFVESFAALQSLLQNGADFGSVKVAVYDDCDVLSKVPGARIVDAHINGDVQDTWQLYTVSFSEFNDALAAQPVGVPGLLRDHDVKEDANMPEEPKPEAGQSEAVDDTESKDEPRETPGSVLVMEQILDDIEAPDDDEEPEPEYVEPDKIPEPAVTVMPEPARSNVVLPKRERVEVSGEEEKPEEPKPAPAPEPKPEAKPKQKRKPKPKLKSYELF